MQLVTKKLSEIKPYKNNPRKNDMAVDDVAESIRQCDYNAPIVVDENNVILAGHTRLAALKQLGYDEAEVIVKEGLTENQKKKYRLLDNKTGEKAEWDYDKLMQELDGMDFEGFDFGFFDDEEQSEDGDGLDSKYSDKIGTVQYEPKETNHAITDLYDSDINERFDSIIEDVSNPELKKMLQMRACWFVNFNFAKIADYYAYQATDEEQRALEALGLVLLDKDDLIKNGFSKIIWEVDEDADE